MAPSTSAAAERQKLLLQQEIAKLSGAISRHSTNAHSHPNAHASSSSRGYHPYRATHHSSRGGGRGQYAPRGSGSGSGSGRGRGAGRGGASYKLDLRQSNASGSKVASAPAATAVSNEKEEGEVSRSPSPKAVPSAHSGALDPTSKGKERALDGVVGSVASADTAWIKGTSRKGNMSLMTAEKQKALAALPRPAPRARKPRVPPSIQVLSSTAEKDGQRVVIDGVIFQFEPGGGKLTRIGELAGGAPGSVSAASGSGRANGTPTRRRVDYGGKQFRRTSRGNLISKRSEKSQKFCRFYTKTGRCNRALTCPYQHSPTHRSICPLFLRGTCPHPASACPLSHDPSPHNAPSCLHFQATAACRRADACPYPHVRVAPDAGVCEPFAKEGWCDATAGTCPRMHVWECPEFRRSGRCAKQGRCGLRHVLRAGAAGGGVEKGGEEVVVDVKGEVRGGGTGKGGDVDGDGGKAAFDDGSSFIGLPGLDAWDDGDQGSPEPLGPEESDAEASGEEEEEEEDVEDDDDDDDEEEEEEGMGGGGDGDESSEEEEEPIEDRGTGPAVGQGGDGVDDDDNDEDDMDEDVDMLGVVH